MGRHSCTNWKQIVSIMIHPRLLLEGKHQQICKPVHCVGLKTISWWQVIYTGIFLLVTMWCMKLRALAQDHNLSGLKESQTLSCPKIPSLVRRQNSCTWMKMTNSLSPTPDLMNLTIWHWAWQYTVFSEFSRRLWWTFWFGNHWSNGII